MLLSTTLSSGQLIFLFRLGIAIFTWGGAFVLSYIAISYSPQVASVETHDVLNRLTGQHTLTFSALPWIKRCFWGPKKDYNTSKFLAFAILLSLTYKAFSTVTDLAFLGLHACEVSGPIRVARPGSVATESDAEAIIAANLLPGVNPSDIHSYRCDETTSTTLPSISGNVRQCTSWQNSTYGDRAHFRDINITDTDALMPRNFARFQYPSSNVFDINMYTTTGGGRPLYNGTTANGIAIIPHDLGVALITGVPALKPYERVAISNAMAVEVGVGCQSLGIIRVQGGATFLGRSGDTFITDSVFNEEARKKEYSGPDNLRPILSRHVDRIRNTVAPAFDLTKVTPEGFAPAFAPLPGPFSLSTQVLLWTLPTVNNASSTPAINAILRQCTSDVYSELGIPEPRPEVGVPPVCVLYESSGSLIHEGKVGVGAMPTLCATTTQVNMVDAVVDVSSTGYTTARITRLPSDLHTTEADYFNDTPANLTDDNLPFRVQAANPRFAPIMRYTLSANSDGTLRHFIPQVGNSTPPANTGFQYGATGGGGTLIAMIGSFIATPPNPSSTLSESVLNPAPYSYTDFSNTNVTRWAGAYGASFIQASIGYNAWSALGRNQPPIVVLSTGGVQGTCYNAPFGIFFLPLVVSAVGIVAWFFYLAVVKKRVQGAQVVKDMYGGMVPTVVGDRSIRLHRTETLAWRMIPHPYLEHVSYPTAVQGPTSNLMGYLKRTGGGAGFEEF